MKIISPNLLIFKCVLFLVGFKAFSLNHVDVNENDRRQVWSFNPPCDSTVATVSVCQGDTLVLPSGDLAYQSGSILQVLQNSGGCDSLVFTTVVMLPNSSSSVTPVICVGNLYTLPDGQQVSQQGTYISVLTNSVGCDSVITTNLVVLNSVDFYYNLSICDGDSATITGPSGIVVSTPGTYVDSALSGGCIVYLITNVAVRPSYFLPATVHICPGDSFLLQNGSAVYQSGNYQVGYQTTTGCDSIYQTTVVVDSIPDTFLSFSLCQGDYFYFGNGDSTNIGGLYTSIWQGISGCDSLVIYSISIVPSVYTTQNFNICAGDSILLPSGIIANSTGVYVDTLLSSFSCDSIVTTNLQVLTSLSGQMPISTCPGDTFTLSNGFSAVIPGIYFDTLQAVFGCDSIVEINLSNFPAYNLNPDSVSICSDDTFFTPLGNALYLPGYYQDVYQTIHGCDSIKPYYLILLPTYYSSTNVTICQGDSLTLPGGSTVSAPGTYTDQFVNVFGCDSILVSQVIVSPPSSQTLAAQICQGDTFTLPGGNDVVLAGTYIDTLLTSIGCDSIVTTLLTTSPVYSLNSTVTICAGEEYLLPNGSIANIPGVYISNLFTTQGCDSIINTQLFVDTVEFMVTQNSSLISVFANTASYQWLNCDQAFVEIAGETNSTFQATANGNYAVQVTQNGCTDTS